LVAFLVLDSIWDFENRPQDQLSIWTHSNRQKVAIKVWNWLSTAVCKIRGEQVLDVEPNWITQGDKFLVASEVVDLLSNRGVTEPVWLAIVGATNEFGIGRLRRMAPNERATHGQ
jgi:hypothetical protein